MKTLFLFISILFVQHTYCQTEKLRDSIAILLQQRSDDTLKVFDYYTYGETFEIENPDSAIFFYKKGLQLAEKLSYKHGIFSYPSYIIVVLNNQGKFKEALNICLDMLKRVEEEGTKNQITTFYINTGSEWQYLSDLESAATYYLKAAKLAEETGNKRFQRVVSNNLSSVFNTLNQFEKAKQYAEKSLVIAKEMNDTYAIASSSINIGVAESNLKDFTQSLARYREVEMLGQKMGDELIVMDGWIGIGDNLTDLDKLEEAETYYRNVIASAQKIGAPEYEMYGYLRLSRNLLKSKKYSLAEPAIEKGIKLAHQLGTKIELKELYEQASNLNEFTGNTTKALFWHKKFVALNDSLINEKNTANINLMEIKYGTEKKEQQLTIQRATINKKNILNYVLLGSAAALLIILLLSYRTYSQKRKLQEQKISELEKEKLLLATQSILKGQEEERSRLAKDLHDGLGGMLSGVKLQIGAMKGNLILSHEHEKTFNHVIVKLDETINEMRRVAHNLMPEALMKLGLQLALQDYCDSLSDKQSFKINSEFHGLEEKMPSSTNIVVYRIMQELLNNAVKYSGASTILAQVIRQGDHLSITVEDNGKGMDISDPNFSKGAGLASIKARVDFLKGQMDIQSLAGKGTSIHIDCKINGNG